MKDHTDSCASVTAHSEMEAYLCDCGAYATQPATLSDDIRVQFNRLISTHEEDWRGEKGTIFIKAWHASREATKIGIPDWWQPIATAPKDNEHLLLLAHFNPDTGTLSDVDFDGVWMQETGTYEQPENYWYWGSAKGIEEPTHWMYQPAVPKGE